MKLVLRYRFACNNDFRNFQHLRPTVTYPKKGRQAEADYGARAVTIVGNFWELLKNSSDARTGNCTEGNTMTDEDETQVSDLLEAFRLASDGYKARVITIACMNMAAQAIVETAVNHDDRATETNLAVETLHGAVHVLATQERAN